MSYLYLIFHCIIFENKDKNRITIQSWICLFKVINRINQDLLEIDQKLNKIKNPKLVINSKNVPLKFRIIIASFLEIFYSWQIFIAMLLHNTPGNSPVLRQLSNEEELWITSESSVAVNMKVHVPQEIIPKFLEVANSNNSPEDGLHIETLAYLIGFEDNGTLKATELIFPRQQGSSVHVQDQGKWVEIHNFVWIQRMVLLLGQFLILKCPTYVQTADGKNVPLM